ncbi:MAG: choline/ethanolamine kinase family protein [Dongiaceae bacterium]
MRRADDGIAQLRRRLAGLPAFAGRDLAALEVTPLPGLTNRSFLLRDGTERLVLRLAGAGSEAYVDRAAEAAAMAEAAALGLAPPVIAALPEEGLLLTRFLPGARPLAAADLADPGLRAAAARLLRRLHGSGIRLRHRRDLAATLAAYRRLAVERGQAEPAALTEACAVAAPLLDALRGAAPAEVPCHIDPVPANFLLVPSPAPAGEGAGPRLYLIDWEYASMCEPAWDLADLAGEAGLDAAGRAALLAAYGAVPGDGLAERVALLLPLLHLLAAAWAALQRASGNPQGDFADLVTARLAAFYAARPPP